MRLTPRMGWRPLAQLSRRLAITLGAGLDLRRVLQREAENGSPWQRRQMRRISQAVDEGSSLTEAIAQTDNYFPAFFREMIQLGERTGRFDRVLPQLADYYEHLVRLRRIFLRGIAWPMVRLILAACVIGGLILAMGWVARTTGQSVDILGFGLVGVRGLVRYLVFLGLLAALAFGTYQLATRGRAAMIAHRGLMWLPGLRSALEVNSLSRLTWSLGLAWNAGADARTSMRLALLSTQNAYYLRHAPAIDRAIREGQTLASALAGTASFPADFLEMVRVGEESGKLGDAMLHLAEQYQQRAQTAMTGLTLFFTVIVWGLVALILIALIIRIFGFYVDVITDAVNAAG